MNAKNIIIFVLIVTGLFGLMWMGKTNQPDTVGASENQIKSALTAEERFYDFGSISMAKGIVSKSFEVSNNTAKDIVVSSVSTSCMCTKANIIAANGTVKGPFGMGSSPKIDQVLKPGEKIQIEAVFNPAAHGPAGVGPIDRFVYVSDDAGGTMQFEIKALVKP